MAAESENGGEKTEAPSGKRLGQAREEGQVGKSAEFTQIIGFTAIILVFDYIGTALWHDLVALTRAFLKARPTVVSVDNVTNAVLSVLITIGPHVLLIPLVGAVAAGLAGGMQTNFLWSTKLLRPRFSLLNPIQGLKRLVAPLALTAFVKNVLKLAVLVPLGYIGLEELMPMLMGASLGTVEQFGSVIVASIKLLAWKIIPAVFIIGLIDLVWQKFYTFRQLKMTQQELKDEAKAQEGDESAKYKIKQITRQRVRDRMMKAVKTADVVVTNPTHISVALSYKGIKGSAPKVVAKGKGALALRIREIAKESKIPIVERKPLARALYQLVKLDREIPYELYHAVAEVLAYIYRLKQSASAAPEQTRRE